MFLTPVVTVLEKIAVSINRLTTAVDTRGEQISNVLGQILKALQKQPQVPGEAVSLKLTLGKAVQQK
jgi:hypothetical protein